MWREGAGPLGTGARVVDTSMPHFAQPVTVVRDDAEGLVVWLSCGTPLLRAARADGRGPDRTLVRKDEDELALAVAVAQGVFDGPVAAAIEENAATVEALVADWGSPFCDGWETGVGSPVGLP